MARASVGRGGETGRDLGATVSADEARGGGRAIVDLDVVTASRGALAAALVLARRLEVNVREDGAASERASERACVRGELRAGCLTLDGRDKKPISRLVAPLLWSRAQAHARAHDPVPIPASTLDAC